MGPSIKPYLPFWPEIPLWKEAQLLFYIHLASPLSPEDIQDFAPLS